AEDLELGDRRRTVHVGGRQEDAPPLLLEVERELAGGRGLPGPVQTHEEEHRGRVRGEPQGMVDGAQETGELAEHDLDDLLTGREALPHLLADRGLADAIDELPRDLEVDVGFEQGQPDLAERLVHVLGPEPASSSKPGQDPGEAALELFKHGIPRTRGTRRRGRLRAPRRTSRPSAGPACGLPAGSGRRSTAARRAGGTRAPPRATAAPRSARPEW